MAYNERYKEFVQHFTSGESGVVELARNRAMATGRASRYIHVYSPSDNKQEN